MLNNSPGEIRHTVEIDSLALFISHSAKLFLFAAILIIGGLTISSFVVYNDHYSPDYSGPGGAIIWALKIHSPIISDAARGQWSWAGLPTYVPVIFGLSSACFVGVILLRSAIRDSHLRALLSDRVAAKMPKYSRADRGIFSGRYNGKILWSSIEDRALVVGPPGTGKTTFMLNQIIRSANERRDFIAVDIKPEIADILRKELTNSDYVVIEVDPVGGLGRRYNPLSDIDEDSEIYELCESLIPTVSGDPVWVKAEQAYFRLALMYLKYRHPGVRDKCSLPAAYQLIGNHPSAQAFLKTIARSAHKGTKQAAEKLLAQLDTSKPAQAGFGGVFDRLNWLALDPVARTLGRTDFSLKKVGRSKRPVAIFLKFEETRLATMGGLLSVLYGHILTTLIKSSGKRKAVHLYLDEIGNIPPIAGLLPKLNTIRSRQLPTWMYWQSTQQMEAYGRGAREVFFGAADLQFFFRSNDINTMETVERLGGKKTIAKHSESLDRGLVTRSVTSERVPRIEAAELAELKPGEVIALYRGGRWRGEATPHYMDFPRYRR